MGRIYLIASIVLGLAGLIFAAVPLRILSPTLTIAFHGPFVPAYQWTAWLCRVPNVLFAEWIIRRGWRPQFTAPERFPAT